MLDSFGELKKHIQNKTDIFIDKMLVETIYQYNFNLITDNSFFKQNDEQTIYDNIKKSKFITIDQNKLLNQKTNDKYYIIGFEKTIIILNESSLYFLQALLTINSELSVCFLSNDIIINNENIQIQNPEIENNQNFKVEIDNFSDKMKLYKKYKFMYKIWSIISRCISAYLIKKCYLKLSKNRNVFLFDCQSTEIINDEDYFELRDVARGSLFQTILIYHIKKEELMLLKKPFVVNKESLNLIKRETQNYQKNNIPFMPIFYGTTKNNNFIVIEYIRGETLQNIHHMNFTFDEKINAISEILQSFFFIHLNNFVYRDLKPNNVMVDENKTIVLIDFDRLIDMEDFDVDNPTLDWASIYIAPEICKTGNFSFKSDIYSLGKLIDYIMNQTNFDLDKASQLKELILKCTDENPEKRPSTILVIQEFYQIFHENIKIEFLSNLMNEISDMISDVIYIVLFYNNLLSNLLVSLGYYNYDATFGVQNYNKAKFYLEIAINLNNPVAQFYMGHIYENELNIDKAIYYYHLSSKQNFPMAFFRLGLIYFTKKYCYQDISKTIHYLKLAAEQNIPDAIVLLGSLYLSGKEVPVDINQGVHYLTIAAKLNHPKAQFFLGKFYSEGLCAERNINKALYYFNLAANQNEPESLFELGYMYHFGGFVLRDINRAIYYYTRASKQNHIEAHFALGLIYLNEIDVSPDYDKANHYLTLAANYNHPKAQFLLGKMYLDQRSESSINKAIHYLKLAGDQNIAEAYFLLGFIYTNCLPQDMNTAIQYFKLAARLSHPKALYVLGCIYYEGEYGLKDANKAIYYFNSAANLNEPNAYFYLGYIYHKGDSIIKQDIDKAIYYYKLAANENLSDAYTNLGLIYYNGIDKVRDIQLAIIYFKHGSKLNDSESNFMLGIIYYENKYIKQDINQAIYYFSLAANQQNPKAYIYLGSIYSENKNVKRDINKAIYYFSLAANQSLPDAYFKLGSIYLNIDINKSFHYFTLGSNLNCPNSQFILGNIYYRGLFTPKDIKKGLYFIALSAKNGHKHSLFLYGYVLHEGKNIKKDITAAIKLYKEASSFNSQYAKNNFGIIHKFGFGNEVVANSANAVVYFKEAIHQKNDFLSMYNLANIYIFDDAIKQDIDTSIDLLIRSSPYFYHSTFLLYLVLLNKFGYDINAIMKFIDEKANHSCELSSKIMEMFNKTQYFPRSVFKEAFDSYKDHLFLYDFDINPISFLDFQDQANYQNPLQNKNVKNISEKFYEGFGLSI